MLESLSILRYMKEVNHVHQTFVRYPRSLNLLNYLVEPESEEYQEKLSCENATGADNQQERLRTVGWIVGFVDGEGCFSVTIQKATTATGWQVFPEFVVTQGEKSLQALHDLKEFFECGRVFINRRTDNHKEHLYRFCVRSIADLTEKIIPFFRENQLRTAKREDFEKFARVLELIGERKHLNSKGIMEIARIAQTMNRRKPSRFLESSETTRQASSKKKVKI